jgi:hypothetical protein
MLPSMRTCTRLAIAATFLAGFLAACQGAPVSSKPGDLATTGPGSTAPAPAPSVTANPGAEAAARAAIDATNLADAPTLDALDAIRFTDEGVAAAAQALAAGVTGDAQWAATWIYASSGADAGVLQPLLTSDDETVRAMAAAAALPLGERAAVRVLVALAASQDMMRGAHPPLSISSFCLGALSEAIDGPAVAPGAAAADAASTWAQWLDANEASMRFSTDSGSWTVP